MSSANLLAIDFFREIAGLATDAAGMGRARGAPVEDYGLVGTR